MASNSGERAQLPRGSVNTTEPRAPSSRESTQPMPLALARAVIKAKKEAVASTGPATTRPDTSQRRNPGPHLGRPNTFHPCRSQAAASQA